MQEESGGRRLHRGREEKLATDGGWGEKVEQYFGLSISVTGKCRDRPPCEHRAEGEISHVQDQNYVVKDGQIVIVDEFTGRLMPGRRYSDGLISIEAKRMWRSSGEQDAATITFQITSINTRRKPA
ncbi:MAG: hypothetical protein ACLTDS_11790 [Bianqueaceae bacterium]